MLGVGGAATSVSSCDDVISYLAVGRRRRRRNCDAALCGLCGTSGAAATCPTWSALVGPSQAQHHSCRRLRRCVLSLESHGAGKPGCVYTVAA